MTICNYSEKCTGCSLWGKSIAEQTLQKVDHFKSLFKLKYIEMPDKVEFISFAEYGLRHRVDFTLIFDEKTQQYRFGFYDLNRNIVDINNCLQMSDELSNLYQDFRTLTFFKNKNIMIKKGSVRLRIGPNGQRGCWLDFSNIDIKNLLQDKLFLCELLERDFQVEIGQKGKSLQLENGILKLKEPKTDGFFKTVGPQNEILNLNCLVSDFTQPSWISATRMVHDSLKIVSDNIQIKNIIEFGSGIGQFTLGFLKSGCSVDVYEINSSACDRLIENAESHNLQSNLKVHCGDYQNQKPEIGADVDLVFVNPARSGLKGFVSTILDSEANFIIYLSCFPESMAEDLSRLTDKYKICNITIYDQFPQTKHYETMILLKKLN